MVTDGAFVLYFRVSTARQSVSGLGLEAQEAAVRAYLNGGPWRIVGRYTEVESGKNNGRAELAKAITACRVFGAKLLIAKLDRLSRDAHFLLGLEKAGIEFTAADMPNANRLTVGIMAMVAEEERRMISARTTAALAAKRRWYAGLNDEARAELRAKGKATQLGGDRGKLAPVRARGTAKSAAVRRASATARTRDLAGIIDELRASGVTTLRGLAEALNAKGVSAPRGGFWAAAQVRRVLPSMAG